MYVDHKKIHIIRAHCVCHSYVVILKPRGSCRVTLSEEQYFHIIPTGFYEQDLCKYEIVCDAEHRTIYVRHFMLLRVRRGLFITCIRATPTSVLQILAALQSPFHLSNPSALYSTHISLRENSNLHSIAYLFPYQENTLLISNTQMPNCKSILLHALLRA
jgi:hypothetical protein